MGDKPRTLTQRVEDVEEALRLRPAQTLSARMKKHGPTYAGLTLAFIGIIVSYFGWLQPQWKADADQRLSDRIKLQIESSLKDDHFDEMALNIASMKAKMDGDSQLLKLLVEKQMKVISAYSPQEFGHSLPMVQATLAVAKSTDAQIASDTVADIRAKLIRTDQAEPSYWGAASAMVNYRYISPSAIALPHCLDHDPEIALAKSISATATQIPLKTPVYADCEITLDDLPPESVRRLFHSLAGISLEFRRCRITYEGGDIQLLSSAPKLIFTNCTFALSAHGGSPGESGKKLIAELLRADDIGQVSFT